MFVSLSVRVAVGVRRRAPREDAVCTAKGNGHERHRPQEVEALVDASLHQHDQGELRDAQNEHLRLDDPIAQGLGLGAEADAGVSGGDLAS